jgi:uncharacterized membrane protein
MSNDEASFAAGAYWLIAIGLVGAVAAAAFGLLDLLVIPRGTRAFTTAVTHMGLNLVVVAVFVIDFVVRANQGYEKASATGLVLTVVALAILGVSGWLGGKLAYRYGVRVADEHTQTEGLQPVRRAQPPDVAGLCQARRAVSAA